MLFHNIDIDIPAGKQFVGWVGRFGLRQIHFGKATGRRFATEQRLDLD